MVHYPQFRYKFHSIYSSSILVGNDTKTSYVSLSATWMTLSLTSSTFMTKVLRKSIKESRGSIFKDINSFRSLSLFLQMTLWFVHRFYVALRTPTRMISLPRKHVLWWRALLHCPFVRLLELPLGIIWACSRLVITEMGTKTEIWLISFTAITYVTNFL